MYRVISYLSAAIIAFVVGLTAHSGVDTLGGFAVEKLCDFAPLVELKAATLLLESESIPTRPHNCGHLVVSVADDGSLYLNRELGGTLDDPGALSPILKTIFEHREKLHLYVPGPDISSPVPGDRLTAKTVYIKAPRTVSYGKVADLIEVIKEAGADRIGLVAGSACQNGER